MKEFEFIESIRFISNLQSPEGIGDDAALFAGKYLLAKDILVENIHFLPSTPIDLVVGKLFTCNVSDICAMGGRVCSALIGVASPSEELLPKISESIIKYAAFYGIEVIGGDTSKSNSGLFLSMTVLGERGENLLTRNSAQPGDVIYLSRHVGLAKLSLEKELGAHSLNIDRYYHYNLKAELKVAEFLSEFSGITCACDVSDGLGRDLTNIACASGVKAIIDISHLDLGYLKNYGVDAEKYFLSSGEEFALLFGVKKRCCRKFEKSFEKAFVYKPLKIGEFQAGAGCFIMNDGVETDISSLGFAHFED